MNQAQSIYLILNEANGKAYVGKTAAMSRRWSTHRRAAVAGKKTHIANAMRNHGVDSFSVFVIERCETNDLANEREMFWIAKLNTSDPKDGYNMTVGGDGVRTGTKRPPEVCAKISAALRLRVREPLSAEAKERMAASARARWARLTPAQVADTARRFVAAAAKRRANVTPAELAAIGRSISKAKRGHKPSPQTIEARIAANRARAEARRAERADNK